MRRKNLANWLTPLSGWIKPTENRLRKPGLVLCCALLLVLLPAMTFAQAPPRNVLLFYSDDPNLPGSVLVTQAIRSTLKDKWKSPIQIYDESQDSFRIPNDKYEAELVALLKRKYEGVHLDLVFALAPPALRFWLKHRAELFPDVPVVYLVNEQKRIADLNLGSNITGVYGTIEVTPTLDLALAFHPQTQRVVVVAGNTRLDRDLLALAQKDFRAYEGRAAFTYLTDLTPDELAQRVAVLPDKTVVIYLSFNADRAGNAYSSPDVSAQLAQTSSAPIYGQVQTHLGRGIVGGRLLSYEALGLSAAEIGLRILGGESANNIAPQTVPSVTMVDWRQLRRWGIAEAQLPAGAVVRYKELTVWEQYKWRIIGAVTLIILQALGIAWLLFTQAKRRQAEKKSARFALLAESEHQHLDEIVANVPGIVWEARLEGDDPIPKTTFVSPYLGKMLGYTAGEWLATPGFWLSIIFEEDREQAKAVFTRVLETGEDGVSQIRYRTKDGGVLWVESHLTAICDESGKPVGLRGVTMNISDRRRAEEALHERRQELTEAQRVAKVGSWEWDPATDTVTWSDEMFRIMGRDPELPAPSYAEHPSHYTPASWERLKSAVEKTLEDGTPYELELEMIRADGQLVWTNARGEGLRDRDGTIIKLRGTLQDIAERKKAEAALTQSEHRFQLVSQATKDILYEWNLQTDFVWWNDSAMYSVFGYPLEEMRHDFNWWEARLHPEDKDRIKVSVTETLSGVGQKWENEYRFRKMDHSYAHVYHRAFIIRDEAGQALRVIGSLMDFTERKQAEAALQTAMAEVSKLKNQLEEENIYLREEIKLANNFDEIVGRSDATKYVLYKIEQVAPTGSTVLVTGETGTGKELVARAIHSSSSRKDRPLVRVNCAALTPTLVESELFGHEKGAFTGATARKIGRFELADGATIFLDEIGELPLELQSKLLRVIQEGEFERLGSSRTLKTDARVIAATNRNLKLAVGEGLFREDLWYRLNVFPITVPPLRDRKEDIPLLVEHFAGRFSQKLGRRISSISPGSLRVLQDYDWPGNIRELANVIERAVINTQGAVLRLVDHFEKRPQTEDVSQPDKTLEEMEREYIVRILDNTGWRIEGRRGAAKILGLNPSTLRTRMAKLGIQKIEHNPPFASAVR